MKDWTGGLKSAYACIGANNHSDSVREVNDYYATDPKCVDDLLSKESFSTNIWECACGEGHISKKLEEAGYNVFSTDLIDRGFGIPDVDFLKQEGNGNLDYDIITNPPYKYATEFVNKALSIIGDGHRVAMFLKLTFLEGKTRYDALFKPTPPHYVYVYTFRALCSKNGKFDEASSGPIAYAWYIWDKGYKGEPIIRWITEKEND